MPNPDEWCREVDEDLFGEGPAESRRRLVDEVDEGADFPPPDARPRRAVPIAAVDTALFGGNGRSASTATKVHEPVVVPDIAEPATAEFPLAEPEIHTAPAVEPVIFDEDDPDSPDERDAVPATGSERRRRRVWAVGVFGALAVVVGAGLGAVALTRSGGPRPEVDTGSEGTTATTATTATTTIATTTPAAPETAAPADSRPVPTSAPRPAPTTTARSGRVPAPAPTEPSPPGPTPPPAPPEPPPPPPTSAPPPTTSTPPDTLPLPQTT